MVVAVRFAGRGLADRPLVRRVARHLRQVRDAQHLMRRAERRELLAEHVAEPAADVRVDLVEHDERADRVVRREHGLQRKHSPRQFAAAGDLPQRPRRLAGVGGQHEFEVVDARGGHVAGHRVVGQRRSTSSTASSFAFFMLQVGEVLLRLGRELLRHLRAGRAQRRRGLLQLRPRRPAARRRCPRGRLPASEVDVSFASSVVAIGDQFVRRLAVARLQLLEERDPLLDLFEPLGVGLEPLGEVAARLGEVLRPRAAALRAADSPPASFGSSAAQRCASLRSLREHLVHRALVVGQPRRDGAGELREALGVDERLALLRQRWRVRSA